MHMPSAKPISSEALGGTANVIPLTDEKTGLETLKNIPGISRPSKKDPVFHRLIFIFRSGISYVILPGIDADPVQTGSGGGAPVAACWGLINLFAGGGFSRASVFALGIMPAYIPASIAMQLLAHRGTFFCPFTERRRKRPP